MSPSRSARRVTPTQALLFRFTRSLVNGVRRAISSPKRILGIVFAVGYYWAFFIRPFSSSTPGTSGKSPFPDASSIKMAFPTPEVLSALLFGGFGVLTLLLTLGLFSFNAAFKSADVDVLFPTPISPRLVLVFRFLQGSFVTLLTPLTFAIFLYRPASAPVGAFFRDYPAQSAALMRNAAIAWVLLALATTSIGFAFSLLSGRDDDGAIRVVRWLRRAIPVLVLLPPAIFGLRLYFDPTLAGAVHAANDPILRAIVPLATAATAFTVPGGTGGWTVGSLVGLAALIATSVGAFAYALGQAPWLYDAAASRGGDDKSTARELARRNDYAGMRSLAAQRGAYKKSRLARRWAERTVVGARAIIWREVVVTLRAGFVGTMVGTIGATFFPPLFLLIGRVGSRRSTSFLGNFPIYMYLAMSAFMLSILAMGSGNMNFIETLRKVDTTKPLPFAPGKVVAYEVISKSLLSMAFSLVPFLIGFIIRPSAWPFHLTGLLIGPVLVFMVMAVQFLVAILFPDFEDPTQRGFRAMIMLLATAFSIVPVFLFPAGAILLGYTPLLGVPFSIVTAVGLAALALLWSGRLYSDYNPSE